LIRYSCSGLILPATLPSLSIRLNTLVTTHSFQWLTPRSKKFYVSNFQTYILDPPYSWHEQILTVLVQPEPQICCSVLQFQILSGATASGYWLMCCYI
jgi:hypothetical protein